MSMPMPLPPGLATAEPPPAPVKPPPFSIRVPDESELGELLAQRAMAKARAEEAEEIFKSLDTRVKQFLARLIPRGRDGIEVPGTRFRDGIRMSVRRQRTTDWDRLRADHPDIDFDSYRKWGRPYLQIDKIAS